MGIWSGGGGRGRGHRQMVKFQCGGSLLLFTTTTAPLVQGTKCAGWGWRGVGGGEVPNVRTILSFYPPYTANNYNYYNFSSSSHRMFRHDGQKGGDVELWWWWWWIVINDWSRVWFPSLYLVSWVFVVIIVFVFVFMAFSSVCPWVGACFVLGPDRITMIGYSSLTYAYLFL